MYAHPRSTRRSAFTLVELLVVIGIIALLISILLPALNRARAAANTTKCLANLRSIGQAMQMYGAQYKGALPGAAINTARYMFLPGTNLEDTSVTALNIPPGAAIEWGDFITPIASAMNVKFETIDDPSALNRFIEQSKNKYFQCPSAAGSTATSFVAGGPNIEVISYNTTLGFLLMPPLTKGESGKFRVSAGNNYPQPPSGYFPNVVKVGASAKKIYAADGAKFTFGGNPQTYNITPLPLTTNTSGSQSKYNDFGPWTMITGSYDRWNKTAAGKVDGRLASYRHGSTNPKKSGDFKLNAVFFDGHCETIDDVESMNPAYWVPRGSTIKTLDKIDPANATRFGIVANQPIE